MYQASPASTFILKVLFRHKVLDVTYIEMRYGRVFPDALHDVGHGLCVDPIRGHVQLHEGFVFLESVPHGFAALVGETIPREIHVMETAVIL